MRISDWSSDVCSSDLFKGFKMRIPGLGGAVLKAAGTNVVNLPGGEIPPALQSGAIDATEWVGPYNYLAFGLYKTHRFSSYPGWPWPDTSLQNFHNLNRKMDVKGKRVSSSVYLGSPRI